MGNMDMNFDENVNVLYNEPFKPTWWELFWKVMIGFWIGGIISLFIFVILSFTGWIFSETLTSWTSISSNPLSGFLLLFIVFLASFLGNFGLLWAFNLFYPRSYTGWSKVFGILLLVNSLILAFFAPMYFMFSADVNLSFLVMAFHLILSIFISMNVIEYKSYPNYPISSIIWTTVGLCVVFLVYGIIRKTSGWDMNRQVYLLILLPAILWYSLIPLGLGVWQKIYHSFYSNGSNPFYISSEQIQRQNNDLESQEEQDDLNIELN